MRLTAPLFVASILCIAAPGSALSQTADPGDVESIDAIVAAVYDEEPFARGINSFQLMNDGSRWWVVSIYWQGEGASNPIPTKYLPGG
jgi:hypothetical protein